MNTDATRRSELAWKEWGYTFILLVCYVVTFHFWLVVPSPLIVPIGLGFVGLLTALHRRAGKRKYFVNDWDGLFHAGVVLDLLLETVLINYHEGYSFYLCAGAFAALLVPYRLFFVWRDGRMAI